MDSTQMISDSILESDEEENEEENDNKKGRPLGKLCILKNEHIPETELPLFLGENVLGRDPNTCTLPLPAPSVSKQHAIICLSVYGRRGCHGEVDIEALVWDLGSMNGTRKGRLKLTPNVRYALSECDNLMVADIPCQYVSCAADTISSQGDVRIPVSRNSGVKTRLPDASGEKGGDTSTGSKKCVNRGTQARVSLPNVEDTRKTPVRTSCLSFEQTPTHPQGTLVPESDSDSDGERRGGADKRRKFLVSDSDSYKSSPTCSTFLSPTNKIVPESEDESPITPSVSTKNRPHGHVTFSKEKTDVDVARQQLKEKKALEILDNSEEEEGREGDRATLGERKSEESGQHVQMKQESNVSLTVEDELLVSTTAAFTDAIPAFNMDSDTDMEGEEEGVPPAGSLTSNTNQQADQPANIAQFHMDSDTDVDEDDHALDKAPKSVPSSADSTKPPHFISVIQPEAITMDSDTDVDDDAAVSDTASKAEPVSFQSTHTVVSAPATQLKDFHLNSDTDADEEEEKECGIINTSSKIDETPTRLNIKPIGPESAVATPHHLHPDSDTDDEAIPAPAISEPSVDLDDSPLVIPFVVTTLSFAPGTASEVLHSDSDADTDVDESSMPPARDGVNPADLRVDSDTDVEGEDVDFGGAGEGQIPCLHRENTPGLLVPRLQNCSTPVQLSEGEVEHMQDQAFLSPSSGPSGLAPALRPKASSSCSDSQGDEDFVVAETQSFILQTRDPATRDPAQAFGLQSSGDEKDEQSSRGGSFQLGLSDSSHLQGQAQALAMENTQAFVSVEGDVNLEGLADRTSLDNDSNLEATQVFGEEEEPARRLMSEKEGQVDLALEATQAYISEPYSNSEDQTDEDERKNTATAETQLFDFPTSSTLAMAETQPMSNFEEEESLDRENPVSSLLQVKARPQNETEERKEYGKAAQTQERPLSEALSIAETQLMCASDDEDLIPGPRKREAKPQPLTSSELLLAETQPLQIGVDETQPMATSENEESYVGDLIQNPRIRKAKQIWLKDNKTHTLTVSELSAIETQPMDTGEHGESDEEDSILSTQKRKAKTLKSRAHSLTISEVCAVETQPMLTVEDGESDDEESVLGLRKRRVKPLQIQEEEKQLLANFEASTVKTLPLATKTGLQPHRGKGRQSETGTSGITIRGKRGTRARLIEEEDEQAECSESPKRRTRGGNKALPTTRGGRGKSRPDDDDRKEEEKVEQAKRAKGKRSMRQQKDDEEEEENNSLIKEQEGREGEEKDVTELRQQETDKMAKERREIDEIERKQESQDMREEQEKFEREIKEKEEQERMQAENAERLRLELERAEAIEKERNEEEEEKERAERTQKEKEQLERERKEKEEKQKLERNKAEREVERLQREEKERIEKERKEQEEKERLETAKRELEERLQRARKEQEHQARLESEAKEREERERLEKEKQEKEAKEKQIKEQQENKKEEIKPKAPARGRREARRMTAASCTTEPEQNSTNDDVPARRTRSRSNSSNSVNSERSALSVDTQESRGRGRGRGAKRTSEPPRAAITRSSNRRKTVAVEPADQDSNNISLQEGLSRSNSDISLNSEISSCRGRGGRQQGRGRKSEADSIPPINSQSDQNSTPKPTTRSRKSTKAEESSNAVPHEDDDARADSQQASTTRGRQRANANGSEPAAVDEEDPSNQEEECANEESPSPQRSVRGRGKKAVKSETVEAPVAPAVSDGDEAKQKRKGRKRELEANTKEDASSNCKIFKGKEKAQITEAVEEEAKGEIKDEILNRTNRRGRASRAQAKKNTKDCPADVEVKEESEKMEEETVEKRGRGRLSAVLKKKEEEQEESETSVDQDTHLKTSQPQTPTSSVSRKRRAPADSSPVTKSPRSSSASPATGGRLRAASQACKVLFTGLVDESGERVLARLGGSLAKGVADMNFLVTDKVRRTVKFLCAVAKGVPIVTTHWLEKSGKAGSFLSPNAFVVKDLEQEKKFSFCLQESLMIARNQPFLQGYEIHVTKSVKPEPVQMKDIITCSGATFLARMPSSHKPQTVVISCEEDWSLCGPALSASLPVVTAEFILTGILQQKLDFQTHSLSAPTSNLQPAGGRGRGRRKT